MIKTLDKEGIDGANLNKVKAIFAKPTADITRKWGETERFSSKIKNKTRMPPSPFPSDTVLGVLARGIRQGNK